MDTPPRRGFWKLPQWPCCPPTLMIPAASSVKNLLCIRPCRNAASLVRTSPDEAVPTLELQPLKLNVQGFTQRHTQLSG